MHPDTPGPLQEALLAASRRWRFTDVQANRAVELKIGLLAGPRELTLLEKRQGSFQSPKPVRRRQPIYPLGLKRDGVGGLAVVEFVIDDAGAVEPDSLDVTYETRPEFGAAAVAAIKEWKFAPAEYEGQPMRCSVRIKIPFGIRN